MALDADRVLFLAATEDDLPTFLANEEIARSTAERTDNHKAKAIAMLRCADAMNLMQKPNEAMSLATEALDLCEDLRFDAGRGAAQALIARICAAHGGGEDDTEFAFDSAQDAVRLFRKLNLKKGEAIAQWSTAKVEAAFGRPEQVQHCAKEAMALFREIGETGNEALACHTLADGYLAVGETRRAAGVLKKALQIQTSLGDKKKEAACLKALANIEVIDGTAEKASEAFATAKQAYKALRDHTGEAEVMNAERLMHLEAGRFVEAMEIGKKIVTLFHEAMDRKAEGMALLRIAEMLLGNNDLPRSFKVCEVALGILSEIQDADGMKEGMDIMGALKHASVKNEMQSVIEMNKDFMHVPKSLVVDPGLNKRIQSAYAEATKQGLF